MKVRPFRFTLMAGVTAAAIIVMGLIALLRSAEVAAQERGDDDGLWLTSAEPAAGVEAGQFSAPDSQGTTGLGDDLETPEGLTSWRVVGSALKPRENDVDYSISGSGGCTYVTAGDNFTVWNVPIALPQGSTIDTLRMYYNDTNAGNSTAWLTVYDLYGEIVDEWSVSSSGSSGNGFNDSDPIDHVIDYSVYAYLLNWRPLVTGSTMQLCGFRIFYNPPAFGAQFLPAVIRPTP